MIGIIAAEKIADNPATEKNAATMDNNMAIQKVM